MNRLLHIFILLIVAILLGCTVPAAVYAEKQEKKTTIEEVQPPTVSSDVTLPSPAEKRDNHLDYVISFLCLILLGVSYIYYKKTGKRLSGLEGSLDAITPKLSLKARILMQLAKIIGLIIHKKK